LVPSENVDIVIPVKPQPCHCCQHPWQGEDPQPHRHQVAALPRVQPIVTEDQLHRLRCPACGALTCADVPPGVPTGGCGPRVQAIVALCTGAYRLSKRTTREVRADLCGLPMSLGTILPLEQATVQAVAGPVADAHAYVRAQPAAHLDETGWRAGRTCAWLWVAVTAWVRVFVVRLSREARETGNQPSEAARQPHPWDGGESPGRSASERPGGPVSAQPRRPSLQPCR